MAAIVRSAFRRFRPLRLAALGGAVALCSAFIGCGPQYAGPVPTYKTAGQATFKGQPIAGATLIFHRQGEALPDVPSPSARVNADGSFAATTFAAEDGAPAGDYVATVEWRKQVQINGDWTHGPNLLPPAYADPGKSPLKITIAEGENVLPPIEIR